MNHASLFRFRLLSLFGVVFVFALAMWAVTQKGIRVAEIEILDFATEMTEPIANDQPSVEQVNRIVFAFRKPEELEHLTHYLQLRPTGIKKKLEVGTRLSFEYREQPLFWITPDNPEKIAIKLLGIDPGAIEQTIIDSGDSN